MSGRPGVNLPARNRRSLRAARLGCCWLAAVVVASLSGCATRPAADSSNIPLESAVAGWKPRRVLPPLSAGQPASGAVGELPPIQLTRPLAPETLARLRSEAETWYRSRNASQAKEAFAMLVELDPSDASAWFRLGNLHQQGNDIAAAARAYRKAADSRGGAPEQASIRRKSLVNLALLGLARARQAMLELEAEPIGADTAAARQQLTLQFRELQGQADALAQPRQVGPTEPASQLPTRSPDRRGRAQDASDSDPERRGATGVQVESTQAAPVTGRKPARRASGGTAAGASTDEAAATGGPVRIEYLSGGPKK